MTIQLNNRIYSLKAGTSLAEFMDDLGVKPDGNAVAIDYIVIPKHQWDATILTDRMELMLIQAISGG